MGQRRVKRREDAVRERAGEDGYTGVCSEAWSVGFRKSAISMIISSLSRSNSGREIDRFEREVAVSPAS